MRKFMWKKAAAAAMTATILATSATVLQAAAPPDGYTNAQEYRRGLRWSLQQLDDKMEQYNQ